LGYLGILRILYKLSLTSYTLHTVKEFGRKREEILKTLKISEDVHSKLTTFLGELVAQTAKMQTYQDAIEAMLSQSVILPQDLLLEIEDFIEKNKQLGFTTKEDFLRDAARWRLRYLSREYEHIEVLREKYEQGEQVIQETGMPFRGVADFLEKQLDGLLEKYEEWSTKEELQAKRSQNEQ